MLDLSGAFMDGIASAFSDKAKDPFQQSAAQKQQLPLTTTFNAQQPQLNSQPETPNAEVVKTALNTKAPLAVEQNKILNADPGALRDSIDTAGSNVKDAKAEIAKIENPDAAVDGGPSQKSVAGVVAGNAAGGKIADVAMKAAGIADPVGILPIASAIKTAVDLVAVVGQGSHGISMPDESSQSISRGQKGASEGYSRMAAASAPVMDNFNRMMGNIAGAAKITSRDVDNAGMTLASQEIKLGDGPLAKMKASIEQLEQKVQIADAALTRRGRDGATVGIEKGVDAVLARDINPDAVRVADNQKSVRIFNNMA